MLTCVKQEMVLDQTCTMIKFTVQNSHSTSALLQQQPDKRLKSDAAKDGMENRRGGKMGGVWGVGGIRGIEREVGQMIQYPKQIRAHIPLLHSASLKMRCCSENTARAPCNLPHVVRQTSCNPPVDDTPQGDCFP